MMTRSTIDLAYPTEAHDGIPVFHSVEEEAAFWDTHDVTDLSELTGTEERSDDSHDAARLIVHLDPADHDALGREAEDQGIAPATLPRSWLWRLQQGRRAS